MGRGGPANRSAPGPRSSDRSTLRTSVQRVLQRAQRAMRPLLGRQKLLLDELTRRHVEIVQMLLVVLEAVVFALFEDVDGGFLAERRGAPFGGFGECAPRAGALR